MKLILAVAFAALVIYVSFVLLPTNKREGFHPYIMSPELHCSDGTVLKPYQAEYADFCPAGTSGLLHFKVAMENNGFEQRIGITPYWPAYPGDCWPTKNYNARSICDEWLAESFR